jgi:type III secretion system FlhB-like substrate exporter
MGILSNIFHKIFPSSHPAVAEKPTTGAPSSAAPAGSPAAPAAPSQGAAAAPPVAAMPEVDVAAILSEKAQHAGQPLNWRTSIVDLLKLLDLDSSLQARKELAQELHYSGDTNDSAAMNIWLHRQVMTKLAQNGGKVPADLRD